MLMPSPWAVLKALPKKLTLTEPAYRDVVVLYRRAVPPVQVRKREKDPVWDYDASVAARNIHVKRFVDVPMADVEMIFPDKTVWLKPVLLMQLAATLVGGLVAAVAMLRPKKGGPAAPGADPAAAAESAAAATRASLQVAVAALTLVGGRAAAVYGQAAAARQAVADAMTERLYDTTMDAQEADLAYLAEEMAGAHVKEAALAYFMLLAKRQPMSGAALDAAIERYLARTFGERVDFAIEASLPRLVADGLVVAVKSGAAGGPPGPRLYAAVPLAEAARVLAAKWAAAGEAPDDGGAGAMALFTKAGAGVSGVAGGGAAAVGRGAAAVGRGLTAVVGGLKSAAMATPLLGSPAGGGARQSSSALGNGAAAREPPAVGASPTGSTAGTPSTAVGGGKGGGAFKALFKSKKGE